MVLLSGLCVGCDLAGVLGPNFNLTINVPLGGGGSGGGPAIFIPLDGSTPTIIDTSTGGTAGSTGGTGTTGGASTSGAPTPPPDRDVIGGIVE